MCFIEATAAMSDRIICAWGAHGTFGRQNEKVAELLSMFDLYALDLTKNGIPKHPLYLRSDTKPFIFRGKRHH